MDSIRLNIETNLISNLGGLCGLNNYLIPSGLNGDLIVYTLEHNRCHNSLYSALFRCSDHHILRSYYSVHLCSDLHVIQTDKFCTTESYL